MFHSEQGRHGQKRMTGKMLTAQHQRRALPVVYVKILAARDRYATSTMDYDSDSVDLQRSMLEPPLSITRLAID